MKNGARKLDCIFDFVCVLFSCTRSHSVAVFAGVSLLVGYVALKTSFSGKHTKHRNLLHYIFSCQQ